LSAHDIRLRNGKDHLVLELHLGIPDTFTVKEAHDETTLFEDRVRRACPDIRSIITHLEPIAPVDMRLNSQRPDPLEIQRIVEEVCVESGVPCHSHNVESLYEGGELRLSFHCAMAGELSMGRAHDITELLETGLRSRLPYLGAVMIHIEPLEATGSGSGG
jgi:divalent metal cation (Fe/Co/Zn/Cd) transporter